MLRIVLAFMALLLAAFPAGAVERRLLSSIPPTVTLATAPQAKPVLDALRKTAAAKGEVSVIVGLKVPFAPEGELPELERQAQQQEISAAARLLQSRYQAVASRGVFRTYASIPFAALTVTSAELGRLAADPLIISITEDGILYPNLAESGPLVRAPEAWTAGYSGLGQTIAIIDTGVESSHSFLAGKVVDEACFSRGRFCPNGAKTATGPGSAAPCPLARCWHGTHVAGIAAGRGATMAGVAKDATIMAIMTASESEKKPGETIYYWSDVIAGLDYVYMKRNDFSIAAVNLSLGSGQYGYYCNDLNFHAASVVENLRTARIATIASTGNDGHVDSMEWPACILNVVSVAAVSDASWGLCKPGDLPTAADKLACFSNMTSMVSLLAPGVMITSSSLGNAYRSAGGTSMAAPHVAGAFAVLRQRVPMATVWEILWALQSSGKPVSDDRPGGRVTVPRIDVAAALLRFPTIRAVTGGTGTGSVAITGRGVTKTCPAACEATFPPGVSVTLTATPGLGSVWGGWSGVCRGSAACVVTLNADATATANFTAVPVYAIAYSKAGSGAGTVTFTPTNDTASCGDSCSQRYNTGTVVKLKAAPRKGMRFAGWSGACKGKALTCSVRMTADKAVTASFTTP